MNTYNSSSKGWKAAIALLTVLVGVGALELVAGAMKHPDPETMAVRQQVLAAQSERAYQIRTLEQGQMRLAQVAPDRIQ